MLSRFCKAFGLTLLLAGTITAYGARPEPNAFINKRVNTHAEFMAHVQNDPEVMDRYMRHFGMNREEVLAYFSELRIDRTPQEGVYLVYNVPDSGELRARVLRFPRGTAVMVDSSGNFIMKLSCGNPMVAGTDSGMANITEESISLASIDAMRDLVSEDELAAETYFALSETLMPPAIPETSPIVLESLAPVAPSSAGFPSQIAFLAPLLAGGMFVSVGRTEPIPEPATMITLAVGLGAVAAARRRRKTA